MRIGIDIDNVIFDTDKALLKSMKKEDKNKRNKGIINKNADYIFCGMFDWSEKEVEEFLKENMEFLALNLKRIKCAKKYINKLFNNEIYLISNRTYPYYKNAYEITVNSLKKNKINYAKLILTDTNDKKEACIKNNIDIMIDDRYSNLNLLKDTNIKCILMKSKYERRTFNDVKVVNNWKELYKVLKEGGIYDENS